MSLPYRKSTKIGVNVTTASTEVVVANSNREYLLLQNDSDTVIYLAFGVAAIANSGLRLNAAGGSYEISRANGNLHQLAVNAIHGGSGNKVCCGVEGE